MKKMVFCLIISMMITSVVMAESKNSQTPRSVSGGSALVDRTVPSKAKASSEMRARPGDLSAAQSNTKKRTKVRRGYSGGSAMADTTVLGSTR